MKHSGSKAQIQVLQGLLVFSGVSIGLFVARVVGAGNMRFWFLVWNLFLAWIPLVCAAALHVWLKRNRWASWQGIVLSTLWLGFLPNAFYLISDFIHLRDTGEVGRLFDAVMLMSFAFSGVLLGFVAIYIVQLQLRRRLSAQRSWVMVGIVLLLCSFAIYMGRFLAWNSWDVIANPGGILFDVSDRVINPGQYSTTFTTTLMFFVLVSGIYFGMHKLVRGLQSIND